MPPKASKKVKVEATPEPKPVTPAKKATPRATPKKQVKDPVVYQSLAKDAGTAIPIDVAYEGVAIQAKLSKDGAYHHSLKLEAPNAFSLGKTLVFTEGPFEGYQAILLRPAKAFPFLKLTKEMRKSIYEYYFAQKGVVGEPIVLEGRRANKEIYAKMYAEGSKNRVGILAVNKEIHEEAISIFYAHTLKLESTTSLLDILCQIPATVRPRLKSLDIKTWMKTSSRNAMLFLSEAKNITRLHIDTGIYGESDAGKAAKIFYADAYKFLEAIGAAKGDKAAGVDVLGFGKMAFTYKNDKKEVKSWAPQLVDDFKESLRSKLQ